MYHRLVKKSVVWSLVVISVIIGIFIIAEISARSIAASTVEEKLRENGSVLNPDVSFKGFPFLLQVARNTYSEVHMTSPSVTTSINDTEIELKGITAVAHNVSQGDKATDIDDAQVDFRIPLQSIQNLVNSESPVKLDITATDGQFTASRTVLKVPIYASFDTKIVQGESGFIELQFAPTKVWAGSKGFSDYGLEAGMDMIPAVSIPIKALPVNTDMKLTKVDGTGANLHIELNNLTIGHDGEITGRS